MASLLALLSQQTPSLTTRKGLMILGLQNDFLSTEGKLPVSTQSGFLDRLKKLVPSFREFGDVIWVRSEFEANRELHEADESGDTVIAGSFAHADDDKSIKNGSKRSAGNDTSAPMKRMKATEAEDDPELFLTRTNIREPCCIRGSWGAEYPPDVGALVDQKKDMQVVKTYYSAFGSTSLLLTLRSKLITELFVCGCNTNLSVFATAMDAARYGIKITLIEDCLGFRKKERHDEAIRQLVDIMEAEVLTSEEVIDVLRNPPQYDDEDEDEDEEDDEQYEYPARALAQPSAPNTSNTESQNAARPRVDMAAELVADSDDDEEDMVLPQVRSSRVPSTSLALRYTSAMSTRSPPLASDPEHASERAEPTDTQSSEADKSCDGDIVFAGATKSENLRAVGADGIESAIKLAGHGGIDSSSNEDKVDTSITKEHASSAVAKIESPKPRNMLPEPEVNDSLRIDGESGKVWSEPSASEEPQTPANILLASNTQPTISTSSEQTIADIREKGEDEKRANPRDSSLFGDDKEMESAGSRILYGLLPPEISEVLFEQLNKEVEWERMHHQTGEVPRLVCCQGTIAEDGSMPVYRHPSDQTLPLRPWSPTVVTVRKAAEEAVGHPLNHALIQLYRGGTDYISEHSDKTLDIAKGSSIVNVSFGAQRKMRFRTRRGAATSTVSPTTDHLLSSPSRTTYRIPVPHNSMLTVSLSANAEYLHGIDADKRPAVEFTEAEKAYGGQRISLTFRHITTFLTANEEKIWGQGATSKTREGAKPVISGDVTESERLVRAFGAENSASTISWNALYGDGSDVLHLRPRTNSPEQ